MFNICVHHVLWHSDVSCALSAERGTSGFWHFLCILAAGEEVKERRSESSQRDSIDEEREKRRMCAFRDGDLQHPVLKSHCTGTTVL